MSCDYNPRAMKFLRRLLLLVLLLAGGAWIVYAFQPKPIAVDVATASHGPLQVTVNEDGKTRIKERFVVSTPLAGRLRRVELRAGDAIVAGETVLATLFPDSPKMLDPRERAEADARAKAAEAAVQRAQAVLDAALAAREIAESQHKRIADLHKQRGTTDDALEEATLNMRTRQEEHRSAKFSLEISEFERTQAWAALKRFDPDVENPTDDWFFEIRSPITGRVLRVLQESAAVLPAGTPVMELGDPDNLELEIDVLSTDAVKIEPGDAVILEHWGGDEPLRGTVRTVEPAAFTKISALGVEEQRVFVIADLDHGSASRASLGDGFRFEGRIVIWQGKEVLQVPTSALFREGDDWAVFVVDGVQARLRTVQLGHRNPDSAEVLQGLDAGTSVVVYPSDRIEDGVLVSPRSN
ncbi:MAG: HlyD family efflux transporter periplasmic adaptor subunit [Planctomycetaceae bacterium]|nr:HlyD family efflux transporter periplasmic adaptor subunit [Planctomycetaceae bacterium]